MSHRAATAAFVFMSALALPAAAAPQGLGTSFESNSGQFPPDVRFSHRSRSFGIEVLADGTMRISAAGRTSMLSLEPMSAAAQVVGTEPLAATASVFVGRHEHDWITGIPLSAGC